MTWIEWLVVGVISGIAGVILVLFACSYYVVTHMNKYGPRMMKIMMKRGKNGKSKRSYSGSSN